MSTFIIEIPPVRSLQQRLDALEHANQIRSARAQLKRDMKAGRATVVEILESPPAYVATMKVLDLLMAAPKVGWVKANKLLKLAKASPSKTLAGLSDRQRNELVELLRG